MILYFDYFTHFITNWYYSVSYTHLNQQGEEVTSDTETLHMDNEEPSPDSNAATESEHPEAEAPDTEHAEEASDEIPKADMKKPNFIKRHRGAAILSGALVLSCAGGFGGAYLAMNMNDSNGKAVFYQGVDTGSSKTVNTSSNGVSDVASKTMDSVVEIQTESLQTNSMPVSYTHLYIHKFDFLFEPSAPRYRLRT